jgi:hypothetical protein
MDLNVAGICKEPNCAHVVPKGSRHDTRILQQCEMPVVLRGSMVL